MNTLQLFALLVYTFGAFIYGALLVLWLSELWGGKEGPPVGARPPKPQADALNGVLCIVSFVWFCCLIVRTLIEVGGHRTSWPVETVVIFLAYTFPPLIMHATWTEVAGRMSDPSPVWRALLWVAYVIGIGLPLTAVWILLDPGTDNGLYTITSRVLRTGLSALFVTTAIYCMALVGRAGRRVETRHRSPRWPVFGLFGFMLLLFIAIFAIGELAGGGSFMGFGIVEVLARSLPLLFVFVTTYYEDRFQFFDLFVKRGLSFLVVAAALTLWLSALLPLLRSVVNHPTAPWLLAVALLPIVALTPWIHSRIERFLDRRWLGRRFSTVDAVTRFLKGLRSATSEADLIARAEEGLAEIFGATAVVRLEGDGSDASFEVRQQARVHSPHGGEARFLLGRRTSDAPYFSQDVALLRSLADVFGSVLDNLRLQERRLAEEQRAQDLSLSASRSELKALRAQINPHFLFNALNAIAGLIHRDPALADRTVEKLADVFRYALRGAESEWSVLEEELEFVRAYLDVEQARFGDRLDVVVQAAEDARGARLPTMIIQTLVENAVKHGAAAVRGRSTIRVHASIADGHLRVEVADSGPGFDATAGETRARGGGGYGLANIRQRLTGYFGAAASLDLARDASLGLTVVTVTLPLLASEPARVRTGLK